MPKIALALIFVLNIGLTAQTQQPGQPEGPYVEILAGRTLVWDLDYSATDPAKSFVCPAADDWDSRGLRYFIISVGTKPVVPNVGSFTVDAPLLCANLDGKPVFRFTFNGGTAGVRYYYAVQACGPIFVDGVEDTVACSNRSIEVTAIWK